MTGRRNNNNKEISLTKISLTNEIIIRRAESAPSGYRTGNILVRTRNVIPTKQGIGLNGGDVPVTLLAAGVPSTSSAKTIAIPLRAVCI